MISEKPFEFLSGTINLLVVEDEPFSLGPALEFLESIPLISYKVVNSSSAALSEFKSGNRYHLCITDLGISDVNGDEFFLVRQFSKECSIIVLTGSKSPLKGAKCIQCGARAVIEKGISFNLREYFSILKKCILLNIVDSRHNEFSNDALSPAVEVLFEKNPASVTEWADFLRISDRQLRNLWHNSSGFSAKHVLFLYGLYRNAFNYYEKLLFEPKTHCGQTQIPADPTYKKQYSYFQENRSILISLLS
jgi:CheY-like chemotaxis protein